MIETTLMKPSATFVALKAKASALRATVTTFGNSKIDVDEDAGVMRNVAIMCVGEAQGHGFQIDATTLEQVRDLVNAAGDDGVKMRFTHPEPNDDGSLPDDLGNVIGVVKKAHVDGETLRGDVHLGDYAECLPGRGNVKQYLCRRAKSNPAGLGLSAVIAFDSEPVLDAAGAPTGIVARVFALDAIDFVGKGAATPNGLLSAKSPLSIGASPMNETLKGILCQMGLRWDSSDEAAQAFYDALGDEQKEDIKSRLKAIAAAAAAEAKKAAEQAASNATLAAKVADAVYTKLQAQKGASSMNEKTKQYLSANHGLKEGATDEEAEALLASLNDEQKAAMTAKLAEGTTADDKEKAAMAARRNAIITDDGDKLLALEGKRVTQLHQLGKTLNVDEAVVGLSVAAGDTVLDARKKFLAHLSEKCKPVPTGGVRVGEDKKLTMLSAALPDAILLRAGISGFYQSDYRGRVVRSAEGTPVKIKPHEMADRFTGLSVLDMYRQWLIGLGAPADEVHMMSRASLAEAIGPRGLRRRFPQVAMLAQSTSDFDSILLDAQNKTLRAGYIEAPRTWNLWAKRGTANDFKAIHRPQTSEVPSLARRKESGEIKYVTVSDSKETFQLEEYVGGVKLTRRVLINDDLNALADIPQKQGQAAARLEEDLAYFVLLNNAAMADTVALFHASHSNVVGSGGGAPSVAQVSATEKLVMLQKGPKGAAILNLVPKFWLGPVALKTTAEQFFASRVDPSKSNETPNPYNGKITPIANARFDNGVTVAGTTTAGSSAIWYLLADYREGQVDTVEVAFLSDEPEPVLKQETDFDTDDVKYAVRHVCAAAAMDHRGMARNVGA